MGRRLRWRGEVCTFTSLLVFAPVWRFAGGSFWEVGRQTREQLGDLGHLTLEAGESCLRFRLVQLETAREVADVVVLLQGLFYLRNLRQDGAFSGVGRLVPMLLRLGA